MIVLLLLNEAGVDLSTVWIIDPFFDGGDLSRRWTTVLSNTPWSKTLNSLTKACPSLSLLSSTDPAACTPLVDIAHFIRTTCMPILKRVNCVQSQVQAADFSTEANEWTIRTSVDESVIRTRQLILAPGGDPKSLNIGIPSIPLEIALDKVRLGNYIKPSQKVLVFGTMHSGTIAIRNCVALGAQVIAYYRNEVPFVWDRDGAYDGIKAEAAEIADKIVSGEIPTTLVATSKVAEVIRNSHGADWAVYAIGFSPRSIPLSVNGVRCSSTDYNEYTGALSSAPAWGFGLAYPNRAPDGKNWDVGIAPFLEHIKQQIPNICSE